MFDDGNPNKSLETVKRMIREGEAKVFIHPPQVAAATGLVCRYGATVPDERFYLDDLIKVLALVNSYVGGEPSSPLLSDVQRLMLTEVRSITGHANLMDIAYRYYKLMEWVPTDRAPELPNPLKDELLTALGLTYDEYAASMLGVATVASQLVVNRPRRLERVFVSVPLLVSTLDTKAALEKYTQINSLGPPAVTESLGNGSLADQAQRWRKPFLLDPLVRTADDELCFTFFPAVPESLGRGLFSRLLTHFNEAYGRKTGNAFLDYYGRFLEDYVVTLLKRCVKSVVDDLPFGNQYSTNNRIVDAVVVEPKAVVFVEVVAKQFKLTDTIISGSLASLDGDVDVMVVQKSCSTIARLHLTFC